MSPFEYTTMTFDTTGSARKAIDNIMKTVFGEDGSITCESNGSVVTMNGGSNISIIQSNGHTVVSGSQSLKTKVDANAKSFNKVSITGPFDVIYTPDKSYGVDVDVNGLESILEHITIYVKNNTLFIKPLGSFTFYGTITVNVKAPFITSAEVNGSGTFKADSFNSSKHDVEFDVNGSGDIIIGKLYAVNLNVRVCGSGDVNVKYAEIKKNTSLRIAGSGDIEVNTLYSKSVSGNVSGSGDIVVHDTHADATQQQIQGSGDIEFN